MRVFIIDHAQSMCDTMARVMAEEPDIELIGGATSIREALPYLHECDLVLVSAELRDDALRLIEIVAEDYPAARVVVMDWAESQELLSQYIAAGLAAYSMEDESLADLLETMRAVHEAAQDEQGSVPHAGHVRRR